MSAIDAQQRKVMDSYGKIPLTFVENCGQTQANIRYYTKRLGYGVYFTPNEAAFMLNIREVSV